MKWFNLERVAFGLVALVITTALLGQDVVIAAQAPDFSSPPGTKRPRNTSPRQTTPARPQTKTPRSPGKQTSGKGNTLPAPEVISLETEDKVTLTCTWFAPKGSDGANAVGQNHADGKTITPFILLHDWDRSREDLLYLGRFLQMSGHAVIVPDFRGHGESTVVAGSSKPIDRNRIRKKEMVGVLGDIETCKKFLMRKNDAGQLNINLLNVAAVGKSSILAMQWAISDWSWAPVGSVKQGQDVKSLILIAPEPKLKGISVKPLLKHPLFVGGPADPLPLLVVYAESHAPSADDASDIYEGIEKGRSRYAKAWREAQAEREKLAQREEVNEPAAGSEEGEPEGEEAKAAPAPPPIDPMKTFVNAPVPRQNQPGSELIASPKSRGVFQFINTFVKQAVLSRRVAYPWQKRLDQ